MNAVSNLAVSHAGSHIATAPLRSWIESAGECLKQWLEAYASAAEKAALYQRLYRLSDAELERRGVRRSELHRWVFE